MSNKTTQFRKLRKTHNRCLSPVNATPQPRGNWHPSSASTLPEKVYRNVCRGFPGIQGLRLCALTARIPVQSPVEELRSYKSHTHKKKCVCVHAHMCTGIQPAGHAHKYTRGQASPLCEARRDVLAYKCTMLCTLRECKHSWRSGKMTDLEIRWMG